MSIPVVEELRAILGTDHVLVDPDVRRSYESGWTGRHAGRSTAVVRPKSTAEVSQVLRACSRLGIELIAQAGNTGLVGGGVPRSQGAGAPSPIIMSMRRLDRLEPVDTNALQVTVGAGVTLASWRAHARMSGLDTPVDFAARDSATIGGAIATNAGGSRVLRYGTMRQQIVGIEAVLANGNIVGSLAGLPKETAGMHWPSLLAGSEGTLAVITQARLRLVPLFAHVATALVTTASLADAIQLLGRLRQSLPSLDAVELLYPDAMALVSTQLNTAPPIAAPAGGVYVLIDCADRADPSDQLLEVLSDSDEVIDTAVATESQRRASLLIFRDRLTEAIAAVSAQSGSAPYKLDVAVPVEVLPKLMMVARQAAKTDGVQLIAFGHLAEGNVHLNFLGAHDPNRIASTVLQTVADLGGTISAEHGIGVAKTKWLHLIRNEGDLAAQAAIKAALDPDNILNPGVLVPDNV